MRFRRIVSTALTAIAACVFVQIAWTPACAQTKRSAAPAAGQRTAFTDKEIIDGFLKIAFGAELRVGGATDRIRKYVGPVRVYIDSRARPDRRAQVAAVIADIRARVQHLDIAVTTERGRTNVEAILVRDRDLIPTIAAIYGSERARQIERSLQPQCLSSLAKDELFRIIRSRVILVVDAGQSVFLDCAYEEILQSLGLTNDTDIPWTMFNDDVRMGFFGIYDQFIVNILYHPNIRPGMTAAEVVAQMPQVLPAVRAWVAKVNGLGE
ncbi:MAG: DUF2927 domain-containing protein [Xanthobacteraceae bacterium]